MNSNEKYLELFEQYIIKIQVISSGFADKLLTSTTREDVQKYINEKNMYLVELNAYDKLVDDAKNDHDRAEFAELRDNYLNGVIKDNGFEEIQEEKNNTK